MFGWWDTSEKAENEGKEAGNSGESSKDDSPEVAGEKVEQKDASETAKDLAKNFGSRCISCLKLTYTVKYIVSVTTVNNCPVI